MIVRRKFHYCKEDVQFNGDYTSVDIYLGDVIVKSYGDYYHDKGDEKSEGFIDGLEEAYSDEGIGLDQLEDEQVADFGEC